MNIDIWSSGITLYAMLCGCLPFDDTSKSKLYQKILSCSYSLPAEVSIEARDLLNKILVREPEARLRVSDILNHPWIRKNYKSQAKQTNQATSDFAVDDRICRLAAGKLRIDEASVEQMLRDNEHNKYTTLYYLLLKKNERGDLELEKELEEYLEREAKKERERNRQASRESALKGQLNKNFEDIAGLAINDEYLTKNIGRQTSSNKSGGSRQTSTEN